MWVALRLIWMWGRGWILKMALLPWLHPNGEVNPDVFEQWPMFVSSFLPHCWSLPHPAPPRELGLSISCHPPSWPSWVSLHLRCLGAAVMFESLEKTPLVGSSPFCLLCQLNRAWLAYLAVHGVSRDLDLLPVWAPAGGWFGGSLDWLWFLSSRC